jgi:hypothetical protein
VVSTRFTIEEVDRMVEAVSELLHDSPSRGIFPGVNDSESRSTVVLKCLLRLTEQQFQRPVICGAR